MKHGYRRVARGIMPAALAAMTLALAGCAGFFVKPDSSSGGSTGTTGSYAYISNTSTSSTSLGAYALASGTLVPVTGSPFTLGFSPSAMVITPGNTFLFMATSTSTTGAIYGYTLATATGVPSIINSGTALVAQNATSLDVSPDGKYLFALDINGSTITQYGINATTGLLSFVSTSTYVGPTGTVVTPLQVKVAPSGNFIVAALGTAGIVIFPYSSGVVNANYISLPAPTSSGDYSIAMDNGNYLYAAQTNALAVYSISTAGVATLIGTPAATGSVPRSVTLYNSVAYTANGGNNTVSAFAIGGTGSLTNLAGSPYSSVTSATSLGVDNSGKYLLSLGFDSTAGLKMYSIGSGGVLTATGSSVPTGTSSGVPAVMALTH